MSNNSLLQVNTTTHNPRDLSLRPSATCPVLAYEVLHAIMCYLNDSSLSVSSRTCRRWSDPALDVLWETQRGLIALLNILRPIQWDGAVWVSQSYDLV